MRIVERRRRGDSKNKVLPAWVPEAEETLSNPTYVRRDISCGVCGRTVTLLWSTGFEIVATGFSESSRYS